MRIDSVHNTFSNRSSIYERLSSGKRINRAADDAAGLAIAQKILKENKGLDMGASNIRDGISAANVADGAIGTMTDSLQRIHELGIQASNGLYSDSDRKMIPLRRQYGRYEHCSKCGRNRYEDRYGECDAEVPGNQWV